MTTAEIYNLHTRNASTGGVKKLEDGTWHLEIPPARKHGYCLAQLDDHSKLQRSEFPWRPPVKMSLQARVSAQDIPGTWGFGLWNDPFSFSMGLGGMVQRFPALPNATWFFHASPQNYLSFNNSLPGHGFLAATFKSRHIAPFWLAAASPLLSLAIFPITARWMRRVLHRIVPQDAALVHTDVTAWHTYTMVWETGRVCFILDGVDILMTAISPIGPLCLVIWIDNQYAALPPHGRLGYGTLPVPGGSWMEIRDLELLTSA